MTISDHNSFDDHSEMDDARLDELLGLATPELDRKNKKRIRRNTIQILKSSRPQPFVNLRSVGTVAATCCLLFVAWIGWNQWPSQESSPRAQVARNHPASKIEDSPEFDSAPKLDSAPTAPTLAELTNSSPKAHAHVEIISRRGGSQRQIKKNAKRIRSGKASVWIANLGYGFDAGWKQLADSESGLQIVERFCMALDRAAARDPRLPDDGRKRSGARRQRPDGELLRQLEILQSVRRRVEMELFRRLDDPADAPAALRLLCRCGTNRSLPMLLKQWEESIYRSDVVIAANRLADSQTLGQLVLATDDLELQSKMMSQLLCRNDVFSLDLFLELTARHDLYSVAQSSGKIAHCRPADRLLMRLRSNRVAIARAAAITLSQMDDPRIPDHLIQLARRPETSQSAVMALTARRDASSVRFVQLAAGDMRWSATIDNARKKWDRLLAMN